MQVTITSPQLVTDHTNPTITINFGGRVAQLNPLLLYNISGVTRTDVVYNVNAGIVAITAYVDNGSDGSDIRYVHFASLPAYPVFNFSCPVRCESDSSQVSTAQQCIVCVFILARLGLWLAG